jgi:Ser/Thr protein kinase RdoA (MazF antagonist)
VLVSDSHAAAEDALRHWQVTNSDVTRPKLGTMNDIFLVETETGKLVLRGHRKPDREAIEFEHVVMDAARAGGVPAPEPLRTPGGERVIEEHGRWWSLLVWMDGEQPSRGGHSVEQAASMGEMLAHIHAVLEPIPPLSADPPIAEASDATVRRAEELLSFVESLPESGEDEASAVRWLTAQLDWLREHIADIPPKLTRSQTIHGDYHDANVIFHANAVSGVLDWDKADSGRPFEELIRALHLSFRLEPERCHAFVEGYRSLGSVTADELDVAANSYGFWRDRSLWFFDELYRQGNERLRPLVNRDRFVPFEVSWEQVRSRL